MVRVKKESLQARLTRLLEEDVAAIEAMADVSPEIRQRLVAYANRIKAAVIGNDPEPLTFKPKSRCKAVPSGKRCRLDQGHVMPHKIDEGPWPEESWPKDQPTTA